MLLKVNERLHYCFSYFPSSQFPFNSTFIAFFKTLKFNFRIAKLKLHTFCLAKNKVLAFKGNRTDCLYH